MKMMKFGDLVTANCPDLASVPTDPDYLSSPIFPLSKKPSSTIHLAICGFTRSIGECRWRRNGFNGKIWKECEHHQYPLIGVLTGFTIARERYFHGPFPWKQSESGIVTALEMEIWIFASGKKITKR
jgi:hypothetical protein